MLKSKPAALLTVMRTGGLASDVTVHYSTSPGTAGADVDYTATGTLTFAARATKATISVPIINDVVVGEGKETFTVTLDTPLGGAVLGTKLTNTVTIVDNDK